MPVQHREEVEKAAGHRDVRNIRAPHLIGPLDDEVSEKVGVDGMLGVTLVAFLLAAARLPLVPVVSSKWHDELHAPRKPPGGLTP